VIEGLVEFVREVGATLLSWCTAGGAEGVWHGSQFHANADMLSHRRFVAGLSALAPGTPVVSDEEPGVVSRQDARCCWLIDPIDGTARYARGFPGYVRQVALTEDQQPRVAVVLAPHDDLLYVAERGSGAFLNGTRLPQPGSVGPMLIGNHPVPTGAAAELFRYHGFRRCIESGSIDLKACRVADDTVELFFEVVLVRDRDLAAPQLVPAEARWTLLYGLCGEVAYGEPRIHPCVIATRSLDLARRVPRRAPTLDQPDPSGDRLTALRGGSRVDWLRSPYGVLAPTGPHGLGTVANRSGPDGLEWITSA